MSGKLYIIGTPIGNLQDISLRVRQSLEAADIVLAEDTRVSQKLIHHLSLDKKLISCHDHNEEHRFSLLANAANDDLCVALISDAGMPLVCDPGYKIVQKALALGMEIFPIPGPSAPILALVGSGLPSGRFSFEGFLPDKKGERQERLEKIRNDDRTLIFFVALSNLEKILDDMLLILGDRKACLAREMTKIHEEYIRSTLSELRALLDERILKGECVLLVHGASDLFFRLEEDVVLAKLQAMQTAGARLKDACSLLARESGWSSSELYKLGLNKLGSNKLGTE